MGSLSRFPDLFGDPFLQAGAFEPGGRAPVQSGAGYPALERNRALAIGYRVGW